METQQLAAEAVSTKSEKPAEPKAARSLEQILSSQFTTLSELHRVVVETSGVEAIHKMRVTTRRAQASLDLLEFEQERRHVRSLKRSLRRARRALSTVRNYDVFLEMTEREAASARASVRDQFQVLRAVLMKRRETRLEKVKAFLKKIDIREMPASIGLWAPALHDVGAAARAGDSSAAVEPRATVVVQIDTPPIFDVARIALRGADRLDQRLAEFQLLASEVHTKNSPAEYHQLRIAAKRIRYLLEIVSEMGYGDAYRTLAWLRKLQDRIGDWHDYEALEDEIVGILSRPKFLKEHLLEANVMLQVAAHLQRKKERLVASLFPVAVPKTLGVSCIRLVRALRRGARRNQRSRPQPRRVLASTSAPGNPG